MRKFLLTVRPEIDEVPVQQRVSLIALYTVAVVSLLVVPFQFVQDWREGNLGFVLSEAFYLLSVLTGVGVFFVTRSVRKAMRPLVPGVTVLVVYLIVVAGGERGLGLLYFLCTFSIVYFVLGYRGSLAFICLFIGGVLIRLALFPLPPQSIYGDPALRVTFLLVFLSSGILGLIAVSYQNRLILFLSRIAYTDPHSGLANRVRLTEHLHLALETQEPFALLGLKLYHFARVSNHRGMAAGDAALKAVGTTILDQLPAGAVAGRWSGSLFVIRVPGSFPRSLQEWGQNLIREVTRPLSLDGSPLTLTAGLAITRYPQDGTTLDRLAANLTSTLVQADAPIGKVRFFNQEAWTAGERRFEVAAALKGALERDEFSLVYQPKVRLKDRRYEGAEVLLRWVSATLGPVSPGEFIPVAEEVGLIREITSFVVDRFLEEYPAIVKAQGTEHARHLHAINLSPRDLARRELPVWLASRLQSRGWGPEILELEITEGIMMSDDPVLRSVLDELKDAGFALAIDDFGTGFSSLSYLHRLEADALKIDQSFVRQLDEVSAMTPIIDAVISLGKALGLQVIAEGVETEAQAKYLLERGCDSAQGWLFSRPLALPVYVAWLESLNTPGSVTAASPPS